MAYWITHLRIADEVIKKLNFNVDMQKYLVGSIATDSGVAVFNEEGKKSYSPSRSVSHWTDEPSQWNTPIHYNRFYDCYVQNEKNRDKQSFYLGYFVHLITDMLWVELISRPVIESFRTHDEYALYGRAAARQDWMDNELLFLKKHPDFKPLKVLESIRNFENIYLDYFPAKAIQTKIRQVLETYSNINVDEALVHPYVSAEKYEQTVNVMIRLIVADLLSR